MSYTTASASWIRPSLNAQPDFGPTELNLPFGAELEGDQAIPARRHPSPNRFNSRLIHEVPAITKIPAELPASNEYSTLPDTQTSDQGYQNIDPRRLSSNVSPYTSLDETIFSAVYSDWQVSQSSAVSALQSYSSVPQVKSQHSGSEAGPSRPHLAPIDTQFLFPSGPDSPVSRVTESPTAVNEHDPHQHELQLQLPTQFHASQAEATDSAPLPPARSDSASSSEGIVDDLFGDHMAWAETFDTASRRPDGEEPLLFLEGTVDFDPMELGKAPEISMDSLSMPPPNNVSTSATLDDDVFKGLLAACELHADSLRPGCSNTVVNHLRTTFDITKEHLQGLIDDPDRPQDLFLPDFRLDELDIETGLQGFHELVNTGQSSSRNLVSLLLLAFSWLCVSVHPDEDFKLAALCLHQCATNWSSLVDNSYEAIFFQDLVDLLWRVVEHNGDLLHIPRLGLRYNSVQTLVHAYGQSQKDFIIEVARTFINVTVDASAKGLSPDKKAPSIIVDPPPSFEEAMRNEVLYPLLKNSHEVHDAVTQRLDADNAQHRTTSPDHVFAILKEHDSRKAASDGNDLLSRFQLPVARAGLHYLAGATRWMLHIVQRSAHRVVSDPTELQPLPRATTFPLTRRPPAKRLHSQTQAHRSVLQNPSTERGRQISKSRRSSTWDTPSVQPNLTNEGPFYCGVHDKWFTGPYAKGAYNRHMKKTRSHDAVSMPCPANCGKTFPRADHLKKHLEEKHSIEMRGRSGNYTYHPM